MGLSYLRLGKWLSARRCAGRLYLMEDGEIGRGVRACTIVESERIPPWNDVEAMPMLIVVWVEELQAHGMGCAATNFNCDAGASGNRERDACPGVSLGGRWPTPLLRLPTPTHALTTLMTATAYSALRYSDHCHQPAGAPPS